MPFICKDCDNKTKFEDVESGTCTYTRIRFIDEDGELENTEDKEYQDYDGDSIEDFKCSICNSNNIKNVSQPEWEAWKGPDEEPTTWKQHVEKLD